MLKQCLWEHLNLPEQLHVPGLSDEAEHKASPGTADPPHPPHAVDVVRHELGKVVVHNMLSLNIQPPNDVVTDAIRQASVIAL